MVVFMWAVFGIVALFGILGMLSYNDEILKFVFRPIIRNRSAEWAAFIAHGRLFLTLAIILDLFLLFLIIYLFTSIPDRITGTIEGQFISDNSTIVGTISLQPTISFEKSMLAIVSSTFFGAFVALLISQILSISEKAYKYLVQSLFPKINKLICNNDQTVTREIGRISQSYNPRTYQANIERVLASMDAHTK